MPTNVFKTGAYATGAPVRPQTLCSVYAHAQDARRILYVHRSERFPGVEYSESEWRCIAVGAEPPIGGRAKLGMRGFYEVLEAEPQ